MEKENKKMEPLTQNEAGELRGGFQLHDSTLESRFFSDNGNCKGGGICDDNVNCSRCAGCDKHTGMETVNPVQP